MKIVISQPELRNLALLPLLWWLQSDFCRVFILFMIDGLNYSELEAGSAFAIASLTAIGARFFGVGWEALICRRGPSCWYKFFFCCRWSVSWDLTQLELQCDIASCDTVQRDIIELAWDLSCGNSKTSPRET